jgi:hypothetical protein
VGLRIAAAGEYLPRRSQEYIFYKVRAGDGNLYILRQQTSTADWTLELVSCRQTEKER